MNHSRYASVLNETPGIVDVRAVMNVHNRYRPAIHVMGCLSSSFGNSRVTVSRNRTVSSRKAMTGSVGSDRSKPVLPVR